MKKKPIRVKAKKEEVKEVIKEKKILKTGDKVTTPGGDAYVAMVKGGNVTVTFGTGINGVYKEEDVE